MCTRCKLHYSLKLHKLNSVNIVFLSIHVKHFLYRPRLKRRRECNLSHLTLRCPSPPWVKRLRTDISWTMITHVSLIVRNFNTRQWLESEYLISPTETKKLGPNLPVRMDNYRESCKTTVLYQSYKS